MEAGEGDLGRQAAMPGGRDERGRQGTRGTVTGRGEEGGKGGIEGHMREKWIEGG